MNWIPWVLDIPVVIAQAQGFYQAHGLTVRQTIPADATDVVKFVATGKSQFGLYYSPDMLMALDAGSPWCRWRHSWRTLRWAWLSSPARPRIHLAVLAGKVASGAAHPLDSGLVRFDACRRRRGSQDRHRRRPR